VEKICGLIAGKDSALGNRREGAVIGAKRLAGFSVQASGPLFGSVGSSDSFRWLPASLGAQISESEGFTRGCSYPSPAHKNPCHLQNHEPTRKSSAQSYRLFSSVVL